MNNDKDRFERVIKLLSERFVDDFIRGDLWNGYYPRETNIVLNEYNNTKGDILNQFKNKKVQTAFVDFNQKFSDLHSFLIEHFSIPRSHYANGDTPPFYYLEPEYHHNFFMSENGRGGELGDAERSRIWREYKTELETLSDEFHYAYKDFISTANSELDTYKPFEKRPDIIIPIVLTALGLIVAVISIPYWPDWFGKDNDRVEVRTPLVGPLTINSLYGVQVPNFATQEDEYITLTNGEYNFSSELFDLDYDIPAYVILHNSTTSYAYSDFNNDGMGDVVAVIEANNGGTGRWKLLTLFLNNHGFPEYTTAYYLGDRISVESLTASGTDIFIDIITQGPDEGRCCGTTPLSMNLSVYGNSINLISEKWGVPETPSEESE